MNIWGHFRTITRHRHVVIAHCAKAGILFQGLCHDLSKYSLTEFMEGAKYYQGTRSPNDAAREDYGYSRAWLHHKGRNRHHFEYWTDYDHVTRKIVPIKMPRKYIAEMFCDRVGASKIYQGENYTNDHPLQYFLRGKATRVMNSQSSDSLEMMLRILSNDGEKAAFKYIREYIKGK